MTNQLAAEILQRMKDLDQYEYWDQYDTDEDALHEIERIEREEGIQKVQELLMQLEEGE